MVAGDKVPKDFGNDAASNMTEEEKIYTPLGGIGETLVLIAEDRRKHAKKVGSVGEDDIPPPTVILDPSGQGEENYVGPVGAKEYTGRVPPIEKPKILELLGAIGGAIKIIGGNGYISLENFIINHFIINQKAMKNIMRIEEGVEGKIIEEKELKPEFEQPKTLEKANELAMRYYLRGIGMGDSLEKFLQYIIFNEYLNPVAVVPKDKFIEMIEGENYYLHNIIKNTKLSDKIKENIIIDNSRLRTGGNEFSNKYIEDKLGYYSEDFASASDKLFVIPNYAALAIFVPDNLRVNFVKFAQVNEFSRKSNLVSITQKGMFNTKYVFKKDGLVPTEDELSRFVNMSGDKEIPELLEFLYNLDIEFSQMETPLRNNPAVRNKMIKEFAYSILQENNPSLCYKGPSKPLHDDVISHFA